jgi:hypothetical protein
MVGFLTMLRAMLSRCRCPPESFRPELPTSVLYFCRYFWLDGDDGDDGGDGNVKGGGGVVGLVVRIVLVYLRLVGGR